MARLLIRPLPLSMFLISGPRLQLRIDSSRRAALPLSQVWDNRTVAGLAVRGYGITTVFALDSAETRGRLKIYQLRPVPEDIKTPLGGYYVELVIE